MARRNDTRAIVEQPSSGQTSHSINVRPVENGFVVCQSSCNPSTGEYKSSETFSKEQPKIVPPRVARAKVAGESLAGAMSYLSDRTKP